jgi:hypothetical protein
LAPYDLSSCTYPLGSTIFLGSWQSCMKSELKWVYGLFPLYVLNFKFQYTRTSLQFQLLEDISSNVMS